MNNSNLKLQKTIRISLLIIEWLLAILCIYLCATIGFDKLSTTWMYNVAADVISIFIVLIIIMGIVSGREVVGNKYRLFLTVCNLNFFTLFFDTLSWILDGVASRVMMYFINTSLYIVNLLITAAYFAFVSNIVLEDETVKREKYIKIALGILCISIFTRLLNIKFGYFFSVDVNGIYTRGQYHSLSYIYTISTQAAAIVLLARSKISTRQKLAILSFTILPFIAVIVSIYIYGLSLMYACVLISIMMIYSVLYGELETDRNRIIEMFGKYISDDVVQEIIDNPNGRLLPGRRYNATALVVDIRGFTVLSQNMNPHDLVAMLNHYFSVVTEIIASYGGIVAEFLGDGLMCIFGAPNAVKDHSDRAIVTGLTIQSKIAEINKWNKEHNYPTFEVGVGINTGTVVLGSLGNNIRAKFTAIGQTVDRTFEIESCTAGGQILISSSTLRNVTCDIKIDYLCDYCLDAGSNKKTQLYEVRSIGGKWNMSRIEDTAKLVELKEPIELVFYVVYGKHTDVNVKNKLYIKKISTSRAVITTDYELNTLDNIKIEIPSIGYLYAKVQAENKRETKITFTSRPEGVNKWIASKQKG